MRISKKKVAKTFEMRNEHFLPLHRPSPIPFHRRAEHCSPLIRDTETLSLCSTPLIRLSGRGVVTKGRVMRSDEDSLRSLYPDGRPRYFPAVSETASLSCGSGANLSNLSAHQSCSRNTQSSDGSYPAMQWHHEVASWHRHTRRLQQPAKPRPV